MGLVDTLILKVRRGDNAGFRALRAIGKGALRARMPLPGFVKPFYRFLYHTHFAAWYAGRWLLNLVYREPMFRSRCVHVGKGVLFTLLPDISGHPGIYIGDNVNLFGKFSVTSGRIARDPRLVIEDEADIGHMVNFVVNREIIIEKGVHIASQVRIVDSDGHPRDPAMRAADMPPPPEQVKPVRICRYAWIGHGCYVMKGVTIGEGAIIGAASVVVTDIPPFSVAMGNPARVVVKDFRKQATPPPTTVSGVTT